MSESTKKAIYTLLASDAQYVALHGKDELGGPAIFNSNMNKLSVESGWTYPCTTFRQAPSSADTRFRESTVDAEIFDFEIWLPASANFDSGLTIPAIALHLDRLLNNKPLTLQSGLNYDCVRLTQAPDLFDKELKLHFGLFRYQLIVSR